jgi:hypothetical protein
MQGNIRWEVIKNTDNKYSLQFAHPFRPSYDYASSGHLVLKISNVRTYIAEGRDSKNRPYAYYYDAIGYDEVTRNLSGLNVEHYGVSPLGKPVGASMQLSINNDEHTGTFTTKDTVGTKITTTIYTLLNCSHN